jgi:asparagine synthase (glutamine-hydrolysing)
LGALVAIIDQTKQGNVVPYAIQMMRSLASRGSDSFGLATADGLLLHESLNRLSDSRVHSTAAIGYNLNQIFSKDIPQPLLHGDLGFAFEGRIYPTSETSDCRKALSLAEESRDIELSKFVHEVEGAYALAAIYQGRLLVARDLLGCKPLYWGEVEGMTAFASEQKALWTIGIDSPRRLPPGSIYNVGIDAAPIQASTIPEHLTLKKIDLDSAARKLSELIVQSIRKRSGDVKRVAIAYSGGVDSAVLASSCRLAGLDVKLFTVTAKDNSELEYAKQSAKALEMPLTVKQYSLPDLERSIPEAILRTEKTDLMNLCIAIPVFWASKLAAENGFQVAFAGQGADELFGGYDRYITTYQREGADKANDTMIRDVQRIAELNLERDEQVTAGTKVELRLPFSDWNVVRYALSLPIHLKIGGTEESLQKLVLRKVAHLQGIPEFISEKPKRAVQYSTGVAALIRLLARQAGMAPQEYVLKQFDRVRNELLLQS